MDGWLRTFRSDGVGKAHGARPGDRRARCGAPVRPPRVGVLETPFRGGGQADCVSCTTLIAADGESAGSAGQPEFTE